MQPQKYDAARKDRSSVHIIQKQRLWNGKPAEEVVVDHVERINDLKRLERVNEPEPLGLLESLRLAQVAPTS